MAAAADNYVCQLDARSAEKAKNELNEDPKDRLNAVNALRTWLQQQPHITFKSDTLTLLYFLRSAKFSQLRARTLIENYVKAVTTLPQWFRDIDTHDPATLEIIEAGYIVPLPKRDKNGCCVLLYQLGATKKNGEMFTLPQEMRAASTAAAHVAHDENVQVNGYVLVFDLTGVGPKHLTRWTMEDMRKWNSCWQSSMPGRFKAFNYYNAGAIFDTFMSLFKPMLSKKMQDRIRFHDTLESLYKYVDMEVLPDEYLPDDYTGPSAGPLQQIIQKIKDDTMGEEFHQDLLRRTSAETLNYDESKRPAYKPVNESFRKLAVD